MRWLISCHKAPPAAVTFVITSGFYYLLDLVRLLPLPRSLLFYSFRIFLKHLTVAWLCVADIVDRYQTIHYSQLPPSQSLFPELLFANNHFVIPPPCRHDPAQSEKKDELHRLRRERFDGCNPPLLLSRLTRVLFGSIGSSGSIDAILLLSAY